MGKKKDKLKAKEAAAETEAAAQEEPASDTVGTHKPIPQPEGEHPEDAYCAAAVAFFTRDKKGKVTKLLLATEERKISREFVGLPDPGKVLKRVLLFPMGRREKKDKNDVVETAKREYVEETGDYGGLGRYLDFADFDGGTDQHNSDETSPHWTGSGNLAAFFAPSRMIVLFCEVPQKASEASHRAAVAGVPVEQNTGDGKDAVATEAKKTVADNEEKQDAEPQKKKRKKGDPREKPLKPSPTYHVGQTDHLDPRWVDISLLQTALASKDKAPAITCGSDVFHLFPMAGSIIRIPDAKKLLGLT